MPLLADRPLALEPTSPALWQMLRRHTADVDAARRLAARALLQLPRLADAGGQLSPADAEREIERLATAQAPVPIWLRPPASVPASPTELQMIELDEARAKLLHQRFHYLHSHRPGIHLAGAVQGRIAVLLSFSPLDLKPIRATLPAGFESASALVLSRVYTTAWAPRNSLSRMLALAASELRARQTQLGLLLTYLNPGLGFDGASYKAANWRPFGREHDTRYAYLDGSYITDRELTRRFGTSEATALQLHLADRISFSRMALEPLQLFAIGLRPGLRKALDSTPAREWSRPWS